MHRTILYFFFQAEDGIRDVAVTGVQTCALPISARKRQQRDVARPLDGHAQPALVARAHARHSARQNLSALLHELRQDVRALVVDRRSTRLNSSHGYISYAAFCL